MEPEFEAMLNSIPGGNQVLEQFKLVFPTVSSTVSVSSNVNSVTGDSNVLTVSGTPGAAQKRTPVSASKPVAATPVIKSVAIPIRVINPLRKRAHKTYMLSLCLEATRTLRHLKEEILEQLGKDVVSFDLQFDVGYYVSSARIHYADGDNIKNELSRVRDSGKSLWCEGRRCENKLDSAVICLDEDGVDCEPTPKKVKVQKLNAREEKAKRVDEIAVELKEIHKDKFNKIQYKLWSEAIDAGKHSSKNNPPAGSIWNNEKAKAVKTTKDSAVDNMASAFTKMADSVASALTVKSQNEGPPLKESQDSVGISPGKKIDYQAKLLSQIDLAHQMFERGAITTEQFEKRRDMLLGQLDSLCQ